MHRFVLIPLVLVCLVFVSGMPGTPPARAAAPFVVNATLDFTDATPGDGVCEGAAGAGNCSLRAAIMEANARGGADTIQVPAGTWAFSASSYDEDGAISGDLDIAGMLTIAGAGPETTIVNGSGIPDRVFDILAGATVTMSGLSVIGGNDAFSMNGGGVHNAGTLTLSDVVIRNNYSANSGGGLASVPGSTLSLTRVAIYDNTGFLGGGLYTAGTALLTAVSSHDNTAMGAGGGLYTTGTATVVDSTISANIAQFAGAGVFNGRTLTLRNSTISDNAAQQVASAGPTTGTAGALYNDYDNGIVATASLTNVTLDHNTAGAGAGGIVTIDGSTVQLTNTIVSRSSGSNCSGTVTSLGHNLETGTSCGLMAAGDHSNTNAQLQGLANNGGPTQTQAVASGSPAIDRGAAAACPATDQRGVARPLDGNGDGVATCDIGAYEALAAPQQRSVYLLSVATR